MHLALIETSPPDQPGSMPRYADLIERAFERHGGNSITNLTRVQLAPPARRLRRWPRRLRNWRRHFAIVCAAWRRLGNDRYDLYHVIDGSCAYVVHWLPSPKTVVTAHDIIPHLQARGDFPVPPPGRMARRLIESSLNGLRRARHIISVSHSTANDLVDCAGVDRTSISVVHSAIPPQAQPREADEPILPWNERSRSAGPKILHLGNNGFYKNREGVVRVFARVCNRVPARLCLAGPPPSESLRKIVSDSGVEERIEFVVNPDDEQIRRLYLQAHLLLFPSRYEGFGWPPLEAMAHGCPVVASTSGSLPEVIGEAGLCCPVDDESALAGACCHVLESRAVAEDLVAKGFARLEHFSMQQMWSGLESAYATIAARD